MNTRRGLSGLLTRLLATVTAPARKNSTADAAASRAPKPRPSGATAGGRSATDAAQTLEVRPPAPSALQIGYAPSRDGDPDAGEVVWAWVPYEENDGRGKDRPVLVIGRQNAERVYAVRLTSKAHDGDRDFLALGAGPWDTQGRPSWVDVEQVYSVHSRGMRREAAALDLDRFRLVAAALHRRYGWTSDL